MGGNRVPPTRADDSVGGLLGGPSVEPPAARPARGTRIPVVSVVGKSDSGKTTLLEGLIREFTDRGWHVGTVKHHAHEFDIDVPGKDSWRHARAGAAVTIVSGPDKLGMVRILERERTLDELVELAGDGIDILLTEGFKRTAPILIEVSRRARAAELVCEPHELFALVTDNANLADDARVPVFGLNDHTGLADLIASTFLVVRPAVGLH